MSCSITIAQLRAGLVNRTIADRLWWISVGRCRSIPCSPAKQASSTILLDKTAIRIRAIDQKEN